MTENLHGSLTRAQQERMLQPPGQTEDIRGNTYIPQHEVRAELTRLFGHGRWDSQVVAMEMIYEVQQEDEVTRSGNKVKEWRWHVAYRAGVQLRIRDFSGTAVAEFTEWHCDETIHPTRGEAHAGAITSAESYAFRRAAIGLGDKFGLAFYGGNNGAPLVKGTLQLLELGNAPPDEKAAAPDPKDSSPAEGEGTPTNSE